MSDRDTPDPLDARCAELLRSLEERRGEGVSAESSGVVLRTDVERLTAHLCGRTDDALVVAASRDAELARALGDVADAVAAADATPAPLSALSPAVAERALAAFDAARAAAPAPALELVSAERGGEASATGPGGHVIRWSVASRWTRVAAAVLLVALTIGVLSTFGGGPVEAGPMLTLEGIERLASDGALSREGPRSLRVGDRVAATGGERWSVRLTGGARVIVGERDLLRVACDLGGSRRCGRAVLELDAGEALVATGALGDPVFAVAAPILLLPGRGRLEIVGGAAHVALSGASDVALSLRADGKARFTPEGSAESREIAGPATVLLRGADASMGSHASDATSLFRDLDFFGGVRASDRPDRRVPARAWRVLGGGGTGAAAAPLSDDEGVPARRLDLAAGETVRLAWDVDARALDARSLRLLVRARSAHAAPGGAPLPDTLAPSIAVRVEGFDGAAAEIDPPTVHDGRPERAQFVSIPLPATFASTAPGTPLVLVLRAERAAAVVWFEGAAFARDETSSRPSAGDR